jgi:hypothetical protein
LAFKVIADGVELCPSLPFEWDVNGGVVLEALAVIEGTSSEELASLVASCSGSVPDPMDTEIGICVGGLFCAVDVDRSASDWLCG